MSETRTFPLRDLLTVTTGLFLCKPRDPDDNGIGQIYRLLGWMTRDSPFTHQIIRFIEECRPWLLRWFPELAKADPSLPYLVTELNKIEPGQKPEVVERWLARVQAECGCKPEYEVPQIPMDELVAMRGTDEGIVLVDASEE